MRKILTTLIGPLCTGYSLLKSSTAASSATLHLAHALCVDYIMTPFWSRFCLFIPLSLFKFIISSFFSVLIWVLFFHSCCCSCGFFNVNLINKLSYLHRLPSLSAWVAWLLKTSPRNSAYKLCGTCNTPSYPLARIPVTTTRITFCFLCLFSPFCVLVFMFFFLFSCVVTAWKAIDIENTCL